MLKILECGGNLFDAVSLAVKAALFNTRVPKVQAALMDGGQVDLTLSDDPYDCERLKIDSVPLLVTICKIGEHCVVDPSAEEEACSSASLVVGVSLQNGKCNETFFYLFLWFFGATLNTEAILFFDRWNYKHSNEWRRITSHRYSITVH